MSVLKPRHLPFKIMSSVLLATLLTTPALANAKRHHKSHYHNRYSYVVSKRHHARRNHKATKRVRRSTRKHRTSHRKRNKRIRKSKRHGMKHHKRSYRKHRKHHNDGFSDNFFEGTPKRHHRAKPVNVNAPSENDSDDENSDPIQQSDLDALNGINDDNTGDDDYTMDDTPDGYTPTPSDTPADDGKVDTTGADETTNSLDTNNPIDQKAGHQFYKDIVQDRGGYIKELPKLDAKATQDAEYNFGDESSGNIARGSFQASAHDYANTSNYIMVTNTMNDSSDNAFMNIVKNPYWNRVGVGVAGDSNYLSYSAVFEHVNPPKPKVRK